MKRHIWVLALGIIGISLGLSGCGGAEPDPLVGTWTFSEYYSAQQLAEMSGEELNDGFSMSMSLSGSMTYNADGTRDSSGEISMDMMMMGQQMPFRFNITETGTWEVQDDILSERVTSIDFSSDDEITNMMLNEAPGMTDEFQDIVGADTESRLISVTSQEIVLEDLESGLRTTLRRQS